MKAFFSIASLIFISSSLFGFSTTNIQYLYGNFNGNSGFDTRDGGKNTITLEHYSTNSIGDIYGFLDYDIADERFKNSDKKHNVYFEISPRISLNKITESNLSFWIFKEWFFSFQYNRQVHKFDDYYAYLYGVGTNLHVKGFDVFGLNIYNKDKSSPIKDTYQISFNYKSSNILGTPVTFNGFTDITGDDLLSQNQLVYKLGSFETIANGTLFFGTEWLYYKMEDIDVDSNVFQLLIKVAW